MEEHSVQFSCSVMYDSLQPHRLQHIRHPCPSSIPRVYSNSCPLSQWCHSTVSSSVIPLSFHLRSFPGSGSFTMSQFFTSRAKYRSFSFSISPSNEYSELISFGIDWLALFSVQGTLKSLLQHHTSKASIIWCSAFFVIQLSHSYMTIGKTIALTRWTFVSKVMCLLFNILSRVVITFLPGSKCLLISWPQSPSTVILEPPKIKSATVSPSISHEVMGPDGQPRQHIKQQRQFFADKGPSSQGYGLKNWCFWTVVLEKTLESLGLQGDPTSQSLRKSVSNNHWKDWC